MSWLKKLGEYAPDIVTAIATGGASLPATAMKLVSKELLGHESDNIDVVSNAVMNATPEQMNELTKINNDFKVRMKELDNQDKQVEHKTTQETIRNGDNSDSGFVRFTRPGQSWLSLIAAVYYALFSQSPSMEVLGLLLALPFTYAGLRQVGKWKTTDALTKVSK